MWMAGKSCGGTVASLRASAQARSASLAEMLRQNFGYRNRVLGLLIVALTLYGEHRRGFGVRDLDIKLRRWTGTRKGFYVELGANDGVTQSNTLLLELLFGWSGVLIEPVSSLFQELRHNRSQHRNAIARTACVGGGYKGDSAEIVYSNLMSTVIGLDSDVGDPFSHAESGAVFLRPEDSVRVEKVPARTLTAVLDESQAPKNIQLLSLDVEGAELEVLRGLDFSRYRIHWVLVECRSIERLATYLARSGYELRAQLSGHDFLFEHKPAP
jgi:FkbM family methyltransferase